MADKEVKTVITADIAPFEAGMKQIDATSRAAFKSIESSLTSLNGPFALVQRHLGAITALLAGGAAFRGAIDATKEWGGEQASLAKQLQITTLQAAGFQVVSRELGLSGDVLVTASDKLTKQMVTNGQAFDKLGISTKTNTGALRATGDVLPEVIEHLRGIKNVTEQNTQGNALFGKSWAEVRGILKISSEALADATQKAKDLNLVIDVEQLKKYKAAMADVKLITTSMEVQIGNALLPTLTTLGKWLGGEGPELANVFKTSIEGVSKALISAYYVLEITGTKIAGWSAAAGNLVSFAADVAVGNLAVAASDLARNIRNSKPVIADMEKDVESLADRWGAALKSFDNPLVTPKRIASDDPPHVDLTKDKPEKVEKPRTAQWEADLQEFKLAQQEKAQTEGRFFEMSKQAEKDYWDGKLALTANGSQENISVRRKSADLGLAIIKDQFDREVAALKTQEDAYKNNFTKKIDLAQQEATLIGQRYGMESKEYEKAQGDIVKLKREAVAQEIALEVAKQESLRQVQLGQINVDQAVADEQYSLGLITNQQLLELEQQFEDRRYQIQLAAQQARIAAMQGGDKDPVALQKENDQLLQIERQHALAVQKLGASVRLEQTAGIRDYVSSLGQNFGNVFQQLLQRQTTFTQASRTLMSSLVGSSAQFAAKMAQDQVAKWVTQSALYKALIGEQIAEGSAASTAAIATSKAQALGIIPASTGVAAIGAAASVASIPYVGPVLAAQAFAAMVELGGTAGVLASAAGGYDIPAGLNPVVQTHAREMILPAKYADMIRGATNEGGIGQPIHNHFTIHAMDGKSVERVLMNSGAAIVASINAQSRSFNRPR